MDCLFSIIAAKIGCIDIDTIVLSNGLANNFRTITYGQEPIYINDGRGFLDSLFLLDKLKITHEVVSLGEMRRHNSDTVPYIFLMPKTILEGNREPNAQVRHLYPFYSAFSIKGIDAEYVTLEIIGEGIESEKIFKVSWKSLENYSSLHSLPLSEPLYVVKLDMQSSPIKHEETISALLASSRSFLMDESKCFENTHCRSGPQFYQLFVKQIESFAAESKHTFTRKEYLKQYLFVASLNSGSIGFYRQDLAKALRGSSLSKDYSLGLCIEEFTKCGNGWREICRSLRLYQSQEKCFDKELYDHVSQIVQDISHRELSTMDVLHNKLVKG